LTEPTYSDKLYNSKQRRLYPTDSNDAKFDFTSIPSDYYT